MFMFDQQYYKYNSDAYKVREQADGFHVYGSIADLNDGLWVELGPVFPTKEDAEAWLKA